jgi:8-amino-7-oxononanoate synthase
MSSQFEQRIRARLATIEAAGERRQLAPPQGVDLCSNDYLGLADHPLLKERMAAAVLREGCGATAARLLRGYRECFTALEQRFAEFKGTDRALFFGSGYAANLAVLSTLLEAGDVVFSDQLNHASLIDGMRLSKADRRIFPHRDVAALTELLGRTPCERQRFLVTESLFSMDGDLAPLREYAELCRETETVLIVDEAHAVGVFGEQGSGMIEATGITGSEVISINTAGKALGVAGAFVAGPEAIIEYLIQRARTFMFSTAPAPALAAAIDAALDIVANEPERRERLHENVRTFREMLDEIGIPVPVDATQIIPVVLGDSRRAVEAAAELQALGFDVRAVRPPTVPEGTSRLRISLNANLTHAELRGVVEGLHRLGVAEQHHTAVV